MKDYITQQLENYIIYKKYNFYKIRKKLRTIGLSLDKSVLLKRIKQLQWKS